VVSSIREKENLLFRAVEFALKVLGKILQILDLITCI